MDNHRYRQPETRSIRWLLCTLIAANVLAISILACVPPVSRDALVHHLALPKIWLARGAIVDMPWLEFSYYPMNLDLLYAAALALGSDILPKYIHFLFGIFTAVLIFSHVRRRLSVEWGLLGVLLFISLPVIVKLSTTVYVDLGLVFFSTAAILGLIRWIESGFRWTWLIGAGMVCGLALGTKYNGLIVWCLLTCIVAFAYARYGTDGNGRLTVATHRSFMGKFSGALLRSTVFFLIAGAVFSPWMIRNIHLQGNPLYPLFDSFFNAVSSASSSSSSRPGHLALRSLFYDEKWWQVALVPLRIFFQGEDGNPQYFDGIINPYLILLPPFAFCFRKGENQLVRTEKFLLAIFSVLFVLIAFFRFPMRVRYVAPMLPALVILTVYGTRQILLEIRKRCSPGSGNWCLAGLGIVLAVLIVRNGIYMSGLFRSFTPLSYLSGSISRDDYIEKHQPAYAVIRYINTRLSRDSQILGLFLGRRGYYIDRDIRFDLGVLKRAVDGAVSVDSICQKLSDLGFTHLFFRQDLFVGWVENNFDRDRKRFLAEYLRNRASVDFAKNGYTLFQLPLNPTAKKIDNEY